MSSTTVDLWNAVASTTGSFVDDSWPLLYTVLGLLAALIAIMLIVSAFVWVARRFL